MQWRNHTIARKATRIATEEGERPQWIAVQRTRFFLLAGGFDSSKNLVLAVGSITASACELWYTGCALNSAVCDAVAPDVDLRISAFSFLRKSYA